jgi:type I restriction enzyme S subunit
MFYLFKSLNLENLGKGIKPGLNRNDAYQIIIAVPPFSEQKAIVAKVEKLLAYCDELEQQIQQTKTYSEQLMQTVLKEAFTP